MEIFDQDTLERIGSVSVRLELKAARPPNIVDTRSDVTTLQMSLQAASSGQESRILQTTETSQDASSLGAPDGFGELKSLCTRLETLNLESVKPFIQIMDELSQVRLVH